MSEKGRITTEPPRTDQNEASVNQTEGSGSADACTAVDNGWPNITLQCTRTTYSEQKVKECSWRLGNIKVWPSCIVKMNDLLCLKTLYTVKNITNIKL